MNLKLEAVAYDLDPEGHMRQRITDCEELALRLDGSEIDGISFSSKPDGDTMIITMEGEGLSDQIRPNYPAPQNSPVMQISFRDPEARLTANTLNKFMRRVTKDNKGKAVLIRSVISLQ